MLGLGGVDDCTDLSHCYLGQKIVEKAVNGRAFEKHSQVTLSSLVLDNGLTTLLVQLCKAVVHWQHARLMNLLYTILVGRRH